MLSTFIVHGVDKVKELIQLSAEHEPNVQSSTVEYKEIVENSLEC